MWLADFSSISTHFRYGFWYPSFCYLLIQNYFAGLRLQYRNQNNLFTRVKRPCFHTALLWDGQHPPLVTCPLMASATSVSYLITTTTIMWWLLFYFFCYARLTKYYLTQQKTKPTIRVVYILYDSTLVYCASWIARLAVQLVSATCCARTGFWKDLDSPAVLRSRFAARVSLSDFFTM